MYDPAVRRRTQRRGREKGCWVYIPAEVLEQVELSPKDPAPWYRLWKSQKYGVMVRLYREP